VFYGLFYGAVEALGGLTDFGKLAARVLPS
jgi:hypothetical protein